MTNRLITYLILALTLLAASCTEKIDLQLEETYERIVVDGFVSDKPGSQTISLSKTSNYFSNAPSPRLVSASVIVSDGSDEWTFEETVPGVSGIYQSPGDFSSVTGKTYSLRINLAEPVSGVSEFESSCELKSVTTLDSVKAVFQPDWGDAGFWLIKIYAQDPPGENNYYMLNLYKNGVLWTDTITKVSISDDLLFDGTYLNGADVFLINNESEWQTLHEGDTIMVELSAITKEYYNFISQVQQSGVNIPFFSGPPANVQGNINNNGAGFFYAYSSSFASSTVKR